MVRLQLEDVKWERDELLGRLLERDFRHQALTNRAQKQMFHVRLELDREHDRDHMFSAGVS